jgi:SpoIID/LytB domain protein
MGRNGRILGVLVLIGTFVALLVTATADEMSTGDKLRILYSNQFTFTNDGFPLVTIELMSGETEIRMSSDSGVRVRPDGEGGSEIAAGQYWTVSVDDAEPAVIRAWTIVARFGPDDEVGIEDALETWTDRGYEPQQFETGTIFGVEGEVIDSREVLIGIAPVKSSRGGKKAAAIASEFDIDTSVHPEMIRRPSGTIVATDGETTVRNPSVIWFYPKGSKGTLVVEDVMSGGGGSQLNTSRETRSYFGAIYVTVGRDGKLVAVNAVPANRLLAGLVPSEIFADSHSQALRAQAIAARTELLQKIGTRHLTDPYLLCSNQHCQVYTGAGKEHKRTTRAVDKTRGIVLLRDGGGLVDARYSASCGGHSEANDHIWGGTPDPSLRAGLDMPGNSEHAEDFSRGITDNNIDAFLELPESSSYCGKTKYGKGRIRWEKTITTKKLTRLVGKHYKGVGSIRALEPLDRGESGRMARLRITGSKKTVIATGDLHIRRLLGGLRSTLFTVEIEGSDRKPSAFVFTGAGFGHGVGMCQTGAIGMAESRIKHPKILEHYYPGSHLQRLY